MRENDFFRFRYNKETRDKSSYDPYHCFDGQLVCRKMSDGKMYLVDTYWSSTYENRRFTEDAANEQGDLTFVVNLDDTEVHSLGPRIYDYYEENDIFDTSHQHNCYKQYRLRKGAKKSKSVMLMALGKKVSELRRQLTSISQDLERAGEMRAKIESGNLDIYI